jgi:hemerythrin
MDWIAWDETLYTGHARMDADHKELAGLFNQLRDAVESGQGKAACARILDDIIGHAHKHFEHEQQMMMQLKYPKAEQHGAEHAMLLRQALDYRDNFDMNSAASRSELVTFPEVWLSFHILFSDKELAAFLTGARSASEKH